MKGEYDFPDEIYIAAMAVSEIKGMTLNEYLIQRVADDELVTIDE